MTPSEREKILQAVQKLVEKKQFGKAIAELERLVATDPKDVRTLLKIGDLYLKDEKPTDAITTYEKVGTFYSDQGLSLKAIAVYKQIREIIHKHVPHLEERFGHIGPRLAEIYTQLGLTSDALAAYDEVATRLQRAGRERDAIDIFRKVVDLDPQNPLPYLRLAEAFVRVKDFDNAMLRFGSAADILLKLKRRDDALKVFERLLQHRPEGRFARRAAEIYLERHGPNDGMAALTKLQICFKENPKDLETLALLARAFEALNQPAKAVEVQKEAARIAKDSNKLEAFSALVDALLARAPNDEVVRQLAQQRAQLAAPPASSAAPASRYSVDVEVDEDMILEDDEEVEAPETPGEAPFSMRRSHPGDPRASAAVLPLDPAARVKALLAQTDALRRAKDYEQAIALLIEGIDSMPGARELRDRICDILIEAGEQPEAVRQMLAYARWLAGAQDVEAAARILDEVLLIEPAQPEALALLRQLGYAVEAEAYVEAEPQHGPGYDPSAPLPSYDLEEVSADDAMARPAQSIGNEARANGRPMATGELDDPFAADHQPLPSFPIDEEATQFIQAPSMAQLSARKAEIASPPSMGHVQLDEEALEEVEFFASQGMFEEAKNLLDEQLSRLPGHPLLLERKRELEMMAGSGGDASGTREVPRPASQPEDRSFDIAASLDALDALDAGEPQARASDDPRQVSVETVFEQFKAGVAAQVSESDAATHYDLGVAYREMGLFSDAIAEFELASRDPNRECVCRSMIGMIFIQQQNLEAAIDAFIRGKHATIRTREQEHQLTYEIADAYEHQRIPEQALYHFQQLARTEPGYADMRGSVAERIRRLEPIHQKPTARAVGAESMSDEFDAALDDLLSGALPGGGKL